jgi:ABC-2 type transport system permease protein
MRTLGVLLRKELHATFTSPIAWVVGGVFLLVAGYTFSLSLFMSKVANLTYVFHQIYVLLVLLVPVITMRSFAEERKTDTLELLLTAPIREIWIVLAKFLGALALVFLLLLASTSFVAVLWLFGEPDLAPIGGGYLALLLLACLLVAVGTLWSSVTENQVSSAVLTYAVLVLSWFLTWNEAVASEPVMRGLLYLSLFDRFYGFASGVIDTSDIAFFLLFSGFFLFLTLQVLHSRNWRGV